MQDTIEITPIAYMRSDFSDKFGIPRQSGLAGSLRSRIVFEPDYRSPDFCKGLEGYSHLWLIWGFSKNGSSGKRATVRPPRLGGNERVGVWASRAPFRPNPLGLSCVKIERFLSTQQGIEIEVAGADLMDHTPIYDIKPYLPYTDAHPEAAGGFAQQHQNDRLSVVIPQEILQRIPQDKRQALKEILAQDPRPSYQDDPDRVYGMDFAGFCVRFFVKNKELVVFSLKSLA